MIDVKYTLIRVKGEKMLHNNKSYYIQLNHFQVFLDKKGDNMKSYKNNFTKACKLNIILMGFLQYFILLFFRYQNKILKYHNTFVLK